MRVSAKFLFPEEWDIAAMAARIDRIVDENLTTAWERRVQAVMAGQWEKDLQKNYWEWRTIEERKNIAALQRSQTAALGKLGYA